MGKTLKTIYDNSGRKIALRILCSNNATIYTREVTNMISTEIPLHPLFETFGKNIVKSDFNPNVNTCRLSVLEGDEYGYTYVSSNIKVFPYTDYQFVRRTNPTCVDTIICASYESDGELTLAPLMYDSLPLSRTIRLLWMILITILVAAMPYILSQTSLKDILFVTFLFLKEHILSKVIALL